MYKPNEHFPWYGKITGNAITQSMDSLENPEFTDFFLNGNGNRIEICCTIKSCRMGDQRWPVDLRWAGWKNDVFIETRGLMLQETLVEDMRFMVERQVFDFPNWFYVSEFLKKCLGSEQSMTGIIYPNGYDEAVMRWSSEEEGWLVHGLLSTAFVQVQSYIEHKEQKGKKMNVLARGTIRNARVYTPGREWIINRPIPTPP